MAKDFEIRKFEDYPKYCRAAIYIGGDRQIHIMQPFDDKKAEAGPAPRSEKEWAKLIEKHGQIVISFEALDDFIAALKRFREDRLQAVNDIDQVNDTLDAITSAMKREKARREEKS